MRPANQINAAFSDAILVGLARRLEIAPIINFAAVVAARESLLRDSQFLSAIGSATASEERVHKRLEIASEVFRTVP